VKVLLVGELVTLDIDASGQSDTAAEEFNVCPAETRSQRYLDSLYRCHPGTCNMFVYNMTDCTVVKKT